MTSRPTREIYSQKAFTSDPEELKTKLNALVDAYNTQITRISMDSSFNGYLAENIVVSAGATTTVEHFLGVIPKWRIILRQEGNGVISDIPNEWTSKYITIKNNGAEQVTLSMLIARE